MEHTLYYENDFKRKFVSFLRVVQVFRFVEVALR